MLNYQKNLQNAIFVEVKKVHDLPKSFSTMISNNAKRRLHLLKLVLVVPFNLVFVSSVQVCSQSRQSDGVTCEFQL